MYTAKTKTKKEHLTLVISSTRVSVATKTDDEIHVLFTIKIYTFYYFSFFLYCAKEGRVVENIGSDLATLKIITTMQKW